jgi:hypothetical protein
VATTLDTYLRSLVALAVFSTLLGCGDEAGECLLAVTTECAVSYEPTYTNIFDNTLRPTCGGPGVSCHGEDGRRGGLVFASEGESYELLLGITDGRPRVIAGDPDASLLLQRLECSSPLPRMPLNSDPLPATARCAIAKWIAAGATP